MARTAAATKSSLVYRLPLTQARINLGALVRRVHRNKAYVILEKDGIPVAGLMDADELEDYLELRDPKVRAYNPSIRGQVSQSSTQHSREVESQGPA